MEEETYPRLDNEVPGHGRVGCGQPLGDLLRPALSQVGLDAAVPLLQPLPVGGPHALTKDGQPRQVSKGDVCQNSQLEVERHVWPCEAMAAL